MAADAPAKRHATTRRLRLAELSSGLGAGVLGLGIGVLTALYLQGLGLPILIAGLILHAWGMTDKHRLEVKAGAPGVWWSTVLYWIYGGSLVALAAYAVVRRFWSAAVSPRFANTRTSKAWTSSR